MPLRTITAFSLIALTLPGCKAADPSPSASGKVTSKDSSHPSATSKPAALRFRTGVIFPETTITLQQLTADSRSPDFAKRYLGKHISITKLVPTGGMEMTGCGPTYSLDENATFLVSIWYDGNPKYDKGIAKILNFANEDTIKKTQGIKLPFDPCDRSVAHECWSTQFHPEKPSSCPFDFQKLVVSGVVSAVSPYNKNGELHLIPHGLSD